MNAGPILVVDDDEDIRTMLCVALAAEGYRAVSACDGDDALAHLRCEERPSLVILDLMMPRVDGEHVLLAMRGDPVLSHIPVAIMSGKALPPEGATLPVVARLVKPVELDQLLALIHEFAHPIV